MADQSLQGWIVKLVKSGPERIVPCANESEAWMVYAHGKRVLGDAAGHVSIEHDGHMIASLVQEERAE